PRTTVLVRQSWRRGWREGGWPRGTWSRTTGAGHRVGKPCHRRMTGVQQALCACAFDSRQEPGAIMPHAGIYAGVRLASIYSPAVCEGGPDKAEPAVRYRVLRWVR